MHSDGAALAAVHGGPPGGSEQGASDLDGRVDAACAAPQPFEALYGLASALRDEGVEQRALYDLFESHRARRTDDADEQAFDGLCDVMDYICGWHAPSHEKALFEGKPLPQAASRAREWEEVREEKAAADETVPEGGESSSSRWQTYAMVAGFLLALASVHGTVAVAVAAMAAEDYTPLRWVAGLWLVAAGVAACVSTALRAQGGATATATAAAPAPATQAESPEQCAHAAAPAEQCAHAAAPAEQTTTARRRRVVATSAGGSSKRGVAPAAAAGDPAGELW
jgi:hypothetical protein